METDSVARPGKPVMAEPTAHLQVGSHKDIHVVEFKDSRILDELNISEIGQTLGGIVESGDRPKMLLDFANVDHLSSAALGMLIDVNNRLRLRNGQLRLCNIHAPIMEVFVITKLNRLFRILGTREEALAAFA
jgi:anti-sigma B factor antagonist